MILPESFYNRSTLRIAQDLLGKFLIRRLANGKKLAGEIIETEAYMGPRDKASHASRGLTPRTALMFGPAGFSYIYLIYGMYYCLNIVTERDGYPAAVLIRAVRPVSGLAIPDKYLSAPEKLASGPGKLCREFQIDKTLNGFNICSSGDLFIEDRGIKVPSSKIIRTPRIGVDYAGEYNNKKWRFLIKK